MPDATEHKEIEGEDAELKRLREAMLTIATLDPCTKGVLRKFQRAVQTARIALGLNVK